MHTFTPLSSIVTRSTLPVTLSPLIGQSGYRFLQQSAGRHDVLRLLHCAERVGEALIGFDGFDLADLLKNLAVVHRIQWILVLQLSHQHLEKSIQVDLIKGIACGGLLALLPLNAVVVRWMCSCTFIP